MSQERENHSPATGVVEAPDFSNWRVGPPEPPAIAPGLSNWRVGPPPSEFSVPLLQATTPDVLARIITHQLLNEDYRGLSGIELNQQLSEQQTQVIVDNVMDTFLDAQKQFLAPEQAETSENYLTLLKSLDPQLWRIYEEQLADIHRRQADLFDQFDPTLFKRLKVHFQVAQILTERAGYLPHLFVRDVASFLGGEEDSRQLGFITEAVLYWLEKIDPKGGLLKWKELVETNYIDENNQPLKAKLLGQIQLEIDFSLCVKYGLDYDELYEKPHVYNELGQRELSGDKRVKYELLKAMYGIVPENITDEELSQLLATPIDQQIIQTTLQQMQEDNTEIAKYLSTKDVDNNFLDPALGYVPTKAEKIISFLIWASLLLGVTAPILATVLEKSNIDLPDLGKTIGKSALGSIANIDHLSQQPPPLEYIPGAGCTSIQQENSGHICETFTVHVDQLPTLGLSAKYKKVVCGWEGKNLADRPAVFECDDNGGFTTEGGHLDYVKGINGPFYTSVCYPNIHNGPCTTEQKAIWGNGAETGTIRWYRENFENLFLPGNVYCWVSRYPEFGGGPYLALNEDGVTTCNITAEGADIIFDNTLAPNSNPIAIKQRDNPDNISLAPGPCNFVQATQGGGINVVLLEPVYGLQPDPNVPTCVVLGDQKTMYFALDAWGRAQGGGDKDPKTGEDQRAVIKFDARLAEPWKTKIYYSTFTALDKEVFWEATIANYFGGSACLNDYRKCDEGYPKNMKEVYLKAIQQYNNSAQRGNKKDIWPYFLAIGGGIVGVTTFFAGLTAFENFLGARAGLSGGLGSAPKPEPDKSMSPDDIMPTSIYGGIPPTIRQYASPGKTTPSFKTISFGGKDVVIYHGNPVDLWEMKGTQAKGVLPLARGIQATVHPVEVTFPGPYWDNKYRLQPGHAIFFPAVEQSHRGGKKPYYISPWPTIKEKK